MVRCRKQIFQMKTVAADVGVNYSNTSAPRDILLFVDFMEKLYSIPFKDRSTLLRNENFYHASKMIGVMILAGKFSPVVILFFNLNILVRTTRPYHIRLVHKYWRI